MLRLFPIDFRKPNHASAAPPRRFARAIAMLLLLCALAAPAEALNAQSMVANWEPLQGMSGLRRLPPVPPLDELPFSGDAAPPASEDDAPSPSDLPAGEAGEAVDPPPPESEKLEEVEAVVVEEEVVELPNPWEPWKGSVSLGLTGSEGNTETFNLRFAAKATYETKKHRHAYEFTHIDKSNDGKKTALNTVIDARIEWLLPDSPWSYYVHASDEYDEFRAFDVRVQGDAGVGYELKTEKMSFISRFGGSFSREVGGPDDRYVPELSFNTEWKYQINDRNKCLIKAEYYPDVTRFQEFRLNGRAEWETIVEPDWGLSLKLSVVDRYDSTPHGARDNDIDYSALLIWSF